jgi:hemoglobin
MDPSQAAEIEAALPALLDRFYARVRADAELGPVFNDAVEDWDKHLATLADFWSSVMLTSGRYKGNPMQAHVRHGARISSEMFERWLAIWNKTTAEMVSPPVAAAMQAKAARIAQSLDLAIHFRVPKTEGAEAGKPVSKPYRATPVFDDQTLPEALRRAHTTKEGVWGVIRVLEGCVRYRIEAHDHDVILSPGTPGLVRPQEPHHVEPVGPMRMQVEFYDHPPVL